MKLKMNKSGLFKDAHCIIRLWIEKRWEFIQDRRGVEAQHVNTTTMNVEPIQWINTRNTNSSLNTCPRTRRKSSKN